MPERIQLRRTAGWRKPPGAISVARPTRWGNPFHWADYPKVAFPAAAEEPIVVSREDRRRYAVRDFEAMVKYGIGPRGDYPDDWLIVLELRGRDLACWCPLDGPCHADVLLEIANR